MDVLTLTVVTPRRQVLEAAARWVEMPAESGQMRALPEHAPTLGLLGAGVVRYEAAEGGEQVLAVSGGFLEVLGDRVTLLADIAELPKDVNRTAARTELDRLQREMAPVQDATEAAARQRDVALAEARIAVAG